MWSGIQLSTSGIMTPEITLVGFDVRCMTVLSDVKQFCHIFMFCLQKKH